MLFLSSVFCIWWFCISVFLWKIKIHLFQIFLVSCIVWISHYFKCCIVMKWCVFQVERMDRKEQEMKKHKSGGWFSGWFGRSSQVKEEEEALTAAAIGQLSQTICIYIILEYMTLLLLKFQLLFTELLSEPHKSNCRTFLKLIKLQKTVVSSQIWFISCGTWQKWNEHLEHK